MDTNNQWTYLEGEALVQFTSLFWIYKIKEKEILNLFSFMRNYIESLVNSVIIYFYEIQFYNFIQKFNFIIYIQKEISSRDIKI